MPNGRECPSSVAVAPCVIPTPSDQIVRTGFRLLNKVVEPALDRGLGNPLPIGVGAVVIETTGRVSGEPRRVPLMTSRIGDRLMVSTVRDDSQWMANLEADPRLRVQIGGDFRDATAETTRGPLNVAVLQLA